MPKPSIWTIKRAGGELACDEGREVPNAEPIADESGRTEGVTRVVGDLFIRKKVGQDLEQMALPGAEKAGDPGARRIRDAAMAAEILS